MSLFVQLFRRQRYFSSTVVLISLIFGIIILRLLSREDNSTTVVNDRAALIVERPRATVADVAAVGRAPVVKKKKSPPRPTPPRRSVFPEIRRNETMRRFFSLSIDALIEQVKANIENKELGWLFENCFPNTLDTTVDFNVQADPESPPDTYVITGDIDAMWLRDSSAQVSPYIQLINVDKNLKRLMEGVIRRQMLFIQRDPYANAHYKDTNRTSEWKHMDQTEMRPGVHERKWELDSLCYVIRLMYLYWVEMKRELTFFQKYQDDVKKTFQIILQTMKEQQRFNGTGKRKKKRQK